MSYDATFSIVGVDLGAGEIGVAIATRRLAVGNRCIMAFAGVGAVASQAATNPYIPLQALDFLAQGYSPEETLSFLKAQDLDLEQRQINMVDSKGASLSFTGAKCEEHACSSHGHCYAASGNMLLNSHVIDEVASTFLNTQGPLGQRLVSSILAGERAGGDKRGKQSAALMVAKIGWHPYIDLRVDDSEDPVAELETLTENWYIHLETRGDLPDLHFRTLEAGMVGEDVTDVSFFLKTLGYYKGRLTFIFTEKMEESVQEFQKDSGLPVNGIVDRRTMEILLEKGGRKNDTG